MSEEEKSISSSANAQQSQVSETFSSKYEHLLNEVETTEGQLGAILRQVVWSSIPV